MCVCAVEARVAGLPSRELFEQQDEAYKESVLPSSVRARVAVEQAGAFGRHRYASTNDAIVFVKTFGASAPLEDVDREVRLRAGERVGHGETRNG